MGISFQFASRRCVDLNNCLPPEFGAGASGTDSSSGYLTAAQFIELLQYAFKKNILIVPQIDYLGGLRSAKLASLRRFKRLESTNNAEANRLFLLAGEKPTAGGELPTDACYEDRALNPCISQTEEFITEMNNYIINLYDIAQVELIGIHAGGDAGVDLFHRFPECQGMTPVSAKRKMVFLVQKHNTMRATIVNEEALIDYSTNDCMTVSEHLATSRYSETCLKRPLKNRENKGLKAMWLLNAVQKYCRMLHGSTLQ